MWYIRQVKWVVKSVLCAEVQRNNHSLELTDFSSSIVLFEPDYSNLLQLWTQYELKNQSQILSNEMRKSVWIYFTIKSKLRLNRQRKWHTKYGLTGYTKFTLLYKMYDMFRVFGSNFWKCNGQHAKYIHIKYFHIVLGCPSVCIFV